ncbi:hypothetical protein HanIR_Chr15g0734671 [Helianthus annuus]|nr:hypothetical protein HanIR_Chr15g0734671 [Helianthus annuus]
MVVRFRANQCTSSCTVSAPNVVGTARSCGWTHGRASVATARSCGWTHGRASAASSV